MPNIQKLQSAINTASDRDRVTAAPPATAQAVKPAAKPVVGNRAGKKNIAAWLPQKFMRSIRMVQAQRAEEDLSLQDLMAEAFNELFAKYNVPTVSER